MLEIAGTDFHRLIPPNISDNPSHQNGGTIRPTFTHILGGYPKGERGEGGKDIPRVILGYLFSEDIHPYASPRLSENCEIRPSKWKKGYNLYYST